jgi:hypothetical protein
MAWNTYLAAVLVGAAGLLVLLGYALNVRNYARGRLELGYGIVLQTVSAAFILSYLPFLILSVSLLDAHTPLDFRLLAPVYVFQIILVLSVALTAQEVVRSRVFPSLVLAALSVLIVFHSVDTISFAQELRQTGKGFLSRDWRRSESIALIGTLPRGTPIYSNIPEAVWFLSGRRATIIPYKHFPTSTVPNARLAREIAAMRDDVLHNNAIIVYFDAFPKRPYLVSLAELGQAYEFPLLTRVEDGTFFAARSP